MNDAYEDLLQAGLFEPPADFVDRVMERLADRPEPDFPHATRPEHDGASRAQWLALAGAALLGAIQLATFMFGIWAATSAG